MLIAHPYHAIHTEKASSLVLEELLLQQRCLMQHLHVIPLSPGSGDELLLLGQATCCSQMAHEYFICLVFCMGMGYSLNTEKQKGLRNVQKNVQGWSALQGAGCGKQGVLRDVSLLRASFPSKSLTFSSFGHLLPTAWGILAWCRSA